MEFDRKQYVDKLIEKRNNGLIKVVIGLRRVGKSYLLNTLFKRRLIEEGMKEENIISFALDSAADLDRIGEDLIDISEKRRKADPHKFIRYIAELTKGEGPYVLLLDEIQMLGAFESVLNGYLRDSKIDVYVTGSNAYTLSEDVATEFGKRGDYVKLYPLSFKEYSEASPLSADKAYQEYLLYGGMPTVILEKEERGKREELSLLLEKIYIRDVIIRNGVGNEAELSSLLNLLASSVSSLTNPRKLSNSKQSIAHVSLSEPTIKKYINYFKNAFLLEEATRYDIKGKSYINTPTKLYFEDLGLRNSRIKFRQFDRGHLFENAVYLELLRRGYSVDIGTLFVSERNANGNNVRKELEIDFVIEEGSCLSYIQCVDSLPEGEKEETEKRGLRLIPDSFRKILLVNEAVPRHYDKDGILILSAFDFFLDGNSLLTY